MNPNPDLYGGSRLSVLAGFLSFGFVIATGISSLTGHWPIAALFFIGSILSGYVSYSLAGGRRNPALVRENDKGATPRTTASVRPLLNEFCELVTDHGLQEAEKLATRFEQLLGALNTQVSPGVHSTIFTGFGFGSWLIVNGVWSNLDNTNLRRDLLAQSKNVVIQRIARRISSPNSSPQDLASLCVNLDFDELRPFHIGFVKHLQEVQGQDEPDVLNAGLLYALEWIQDKLGLSDSQMNWIVPQLVTEDMDLNSVVEMAYQTNRAAERGRT